MPAENLTRDEARQRAEHLKIASYLVELDLSGGAETFTSRTTINFSSDDGADTFLDFIAATVHSVNINGQARDISYADSRLALSGLTAGDNEVVIEADCYYMNTGEGLHRFVDPADGQTYLYSQFEVADCRRVFPVFEQPDLKASFEFHIRAPRTWKVFSNSPTPEPIDVPDETGEGESAVGLWKFAPTERISSYLTAIVAGPYEGVTGELTSADGRTIPLGVYARASLAEHLNGEEIMDITRAGFAFYEREFDFPYPFAKYDQIFVPEFNAGAMENVGCVTFTDDLVFRSRPSGAQREQLVITILHELAHMWFGDLVTMRWWNDLWLNESFAEFMSYLSTAEATEWSDAWTSFHASQKAWAIGQDELPSTHPVVADIRDLEDVLVNFDGITYAKGGSVLKQLVAYVGREQFMAGVRAYFKKHAWSNAVMADLLTELAAASGRDLDRWQKLWLEESGVNVLRPEIELGAGSTISRLAIRQEPGIGEASLRPHRLGVGFYTLEGATLRRTEHFELDIDGELTEVEQAAGLPRPDLLLVNDGDWAYAKIRLDEHSLATAVRHIDAFDDELAATMVLGAAWDMVRDAEMTARSYASLALRALRADPHPTVIHTLLRHLHTALRYYTDPFDRDGLMAEAGSALMRIVREAEPGSEIQFQAALNLGVFAEGADRLTVLGWLMGKKVPRGLEIDQDLRWNLLRSLAMHGAVTREMIELELESDNSSRGKERAARALAALPEEEEKARVWREVVEDISLPNITQRMTVLGFADSEADLLVPYVAKYHEAITDIWARQGHEMRSMALQGLYPLSLAGRTDLGVDLIGETRAWLAANEDQPAALLRLIRENLDDAERAVRAQARDARETLHHQQDGAM